MPISGRHSNGTTLGELKIQKSVIFEQVYWHRPIVSPLPAGKMDRSGSAGRALGLAVAGRPTETGRAGGVWEGAGLSVDIWIAPLVESWSSQTTDNEVGYVF